MTWQWVTLILGIIFLILAALNVAVFATKNTTSADSSPQVDVDNS